MGLEELEIGKGIETIQTTPLFKIGQNTEKSPRDMRRLVSSQTQVKNYKLMLV